MEPATKNLPKKCPRCDAVRLDVIADEGPTAKSATARYACGSVYLAFDGRWQPPFCVARCEEEPEPGRILRSAGEQENDDVPEDFDEEFLAKADLEHSFARLRGCRHFHAETMRGRIRSLQLRVDDAWRHFDRAQELSDQAPDTIPNLIRVFSLNLFLFEHALLEAPVRSEAVAQAEAPEPPAESALDAALGRYPELAGVLRQKLAADGLMLFHAGAFDLAAERFEELIRTETLNDALAEYYVDLAACQENQGQHDLARKSIENAGLSTQSAVYTLTRARAAGVLVGFHRYLGEGAEADDWEDFLWRLPCPEATKKVFLKRGEWIEKRSGRESRLVLL